MHPLTDYVRNRDILRQKEIPNRTAAGLRLVVPVEVVHKSIKSVVRIPSTYAAGPLSWNKANAGENVPIVNVNPEVANPRWPNEPSGVIGAVFFQACAHTELL